MCEIPSWMTLLLLTSETSLLYFYFLFKGRLNNALKTLVYELFLKTFYKENDKIINVVDSFLYLS